MAYLQSAPLKTLLAKSDIVLLELVLNQIQNEKSLSPGLAIDVPNSRCSFPESVKLHALLIIQLAIVVAQLLAVQW
jgi:hypothetical protein